MKTIAKLVKDWETKNTRNVAKSGGVSMMAFRLLHVAEAVRRHLSLKKRQWLSRRLWLCRSRKL